MASQTVGGFINQVVKTGTSPGSGSFNIGLASYVFYNSARLEYGAATENLNFPYYLGYSQDKQHYRYQDQLNGASLGYLQPSSYSVPTFQSQSPFPNCVKHLKVVVKS